MSNMQIHILSEVNIITKTGSIKRDITHKKLDDTEIYEIIQFFENQLTLLEVTAPPIYLGPIGHKVPT
jgi:hypothetical protein